MTNDFKKVSEEIRKELEQIRKDAQKQFVSGAYDLQRQIVRRFYSGTAVSINGGLRRRTGSAAKSWQVAKTTNGDTIEVSVFSAGVAHADFSKPKTITAKKQYLVIPVGPALTRAGAPRYPGNSQGKGSIQQAENAMRMPQPKGSRGFASVFGGKKQSPFSWIKKGESMFVVAKKGVSGPGITSQNRLLFVLKKTVKVPAYTQGLMPYAQRHGDDIAAMIKGILK